MPNDLESLKQSLLGSKNDTSLDSLKESVLSEPVPTAPDNGDIYLPGPKESLIDRSISAAKAPFIGAASGIRDVASAVGRFTGMDSASDELDRESQRNLELAGADSGLPRLLSSGGRNISQMAFGAPFGPVGAMVPAVGVTIGQAKKNAEDAGLGGGEKYGYMATQGILEAAPELIAQKLGMPGVEKVLADAMRNYGVSGLKQATKELAKSAGHEVLTELPTSYGQAQADKSFGIDKTPWTTDQAIDVGVDTILQTLVTTGMAGSPNLIRSVLQERQNIDQMAQQDALRRMSPANAQITAVPQSPVDQLHNFFSGNKTPDPSMTPAQADAVAKQQVPIPQTIPQPVTNEPILLPQQPLPEVVNAIPQAAPTQPIPQPQVAQPAAPLPVQGGMVDIPTAQEAQRPHAEVAPGAESAITDSMFDERIKKYNGDSSKAVDDVIKIVKEQISNGKSVTLITNGRRVPVVKVNKLGMVDKDGNAWGALAVLWPRSGGRIEFGTNKTPSAPTVVERPLETKPVVSSETPVGTTQKNQPAPTQPTISKNETVQIGGADDQNQGAATRIDGKLGEQVDKGRVTKQLQNADKITDFGEKLGGARKDRLTLADLDKMTSEERQDNVNKNAVWPEINHAEQIANGQPAQIAHLVHQIRATIASKPNISSSDNKDPVKREAAIREYVDTVGRIRDLLAAAKTKEDIKAVHKAVFPGLHNMNQWGLKVVDNTTGESIETASKRYHTIASNKGLNKTLQASYLAIKRADTAVSKGWPKAPAWNSRYEVQPYSPSNSKAGDPLRYIVRAKNEQQRRDERAAGLTGDFATKQEAENEAARRYGDLGKKANKNKSLVRPIRPDAKRIGPDIRNGRDIKPEDFSKAFGFRGTEFGNWTNQADRQQSLNQAYDALHDLAELMGIPPDAISLNGKLGLAFGARGKSSAMAHYEPGKVVINLTKMRGSGALAHEWAHALDNYFGKQASAGDIAAYSSDVGVSRKAITDIAGKSGVRPEVVQAWLDIHKAMTIDPETNKRTRFYNNSLSEDSGKKKPYWSSDHEMFARSFETWAAQKLENMDRQSPYLVQGVPTAETEQVSKDLFGEEWKNIYPQGKDAENIGSKIDGLVGSLKTEQTEKGSRLYSTNTETSARNTTPDATGNIGKQIGDLRDAGNAFIQHFDTLAKGNATMTLLPAQGLVRIDFLGGNHLYLRPVDSIPVPAEEIARAKAAGEIPEDTPEENITAQGSVITFDGTKLIQLAKNAGKSTAWHEALHAARGMGLIREETWAALEKKYGEGRTGVDAEEAIAREMEKPGTPLSGFVAHIRRVLARLGAWLRSKGMTIQLPGEEEAATVAKSDIQSGRAFLNEPTNKPESGARFSAGNMEGESKKEKPKEGDRPFTALGGKNRPIRDKNRGREAVVKRIAHAVSRGEGEITPDDLSFINNLLHKFDTELSDDLSVSLRKYGDNGLFGSYSSNAALMDLFLPNRHGASETFAHEFGHHLERYLPDHTYMKKIREEMESQKKIYAHDHPWYAYQLEKGSRIGFKGVQPTEEQTDYVYRFVDPQEYFAERFRELSFEQLMDEENINQGGLRGAFAYVSQPFRWLFRKLKERFGYDAARTAWDALREPNWKKPINHGRRSSVTEMNDRDSGDIRFKLDVGEPPKPPTGTETGRPDLANPATTEEGRQFVRNVRGSMENANEPGERDWETVNKEADKRDTPATRDDIRAKIDKGDFLTDTEVVIARRMIDKDAAAALKGDDPVLQRAMVRLVAGFTRIGTATARALAIRRDPLKSPTERMQEALVNAIYDLPREKNKTIQKLRDQQQKNPNDTDTVKRLQRQIDRITEEHEKTVKKIHDHLRRLGIDPSDINGMSPAKAQEAIREAAAMKGDAFDAVYEFWINSILSGPLTHSANIAGNIANSVLIYGAEKPLRAALNLITPGKNRTGSAESFAELKHLYAGMGPGFARSGRAFIDAWRTERARLQEEIEHSNQLGSNQGEGHQPAISGKKGRIIRLPTRFMLATDEFFKSLIAQMEVGAQAYRSGKARGLSGPELESHIQDQTGNLGSQAWQAALDEARKATFQDPNALASGLSKVRASAPGLRYILPFILTPTNIFARGLRLTPLGSVNIAQRILREGLMRWKPESRAALDYTRSELIQHVVEMAVGTATLLAIAASIGDEDDPWITGTEAASGSGTRDLTQRTAPPFSVKVGDKWVSYGRIEPAATAIATMVDLAKQINKGDANAETLKKAMESITEQVKNKTFLRTAGDLMEIVTNPEAQGANKAADVVRGIGTGFVPNILRQTVQTQDDTINEKRPFARSWTSAWWGEQGRIFTNESLGGLRYTPKVDLWGREVKKGTMNNEAADTLIRLISPVQFRDDVTNEWDAALRSWNNSDNGPNMAPAQPRNYIEDRQTQRRWYFTPKQYETMLKERGKQLTKIVSNRRPSSVSNPTKQDIKYISGAVKAATKITMQKYRLMAKNAGIQDSDGD